VDGRNHAASLPLRQRKKGRSAASLLSHTRAEKSQAPALLSHGGDRGKKHASPGAAAITLRRENNMHHQVAVSTKLIRCEENNSVGPVFSKNYMVTVRLLYIIDMNNM
jgi:hypothetical protein